jgi:hypothetical protein
MTLIRYLSDAFDALPWQWQIVVCALVLLTATAAIGVSYIMRQDLRGGEWPTAESIARAKAAQRAERIKGGLDPETGWPRKASTGLDAISAGARRRKPYCDEDAATPERRARLARMQTRN